MYKLRVGIMSLLLVFLFQTPISKNTVVLADQPQTTQIEEGTLDERAQILQAYLAKYDSPLQYHAQDFIDAADKYHLDWKLVPAISGVESTFGRETPGGYNGWGWGVYGDQALGFNSWRDGIFTVSEGLRTRYFDRGLTNPYTINTVYASSQSWGAHVNYFLNDLTKFEKQYKGIKTTAPMAMVLDLDRLPTATSAQVASQLH